ncbi:hypothetical protein E4195_16295 [Pseudomonas putida]|nr:hypothetical protein E4195_16295 [Pseudomonas putida]
MHWWWARGGPGHRALIDASRHGLFAGSPAKGPALLANFHPSFTVAAATVFAGKPAPTQIGGGHTLVIGRRPS